MERARPELWAAALMALWLLSCPQVARANVGTVVAGPVVRCDPCDARAQQLCAPPPAALACAELVREPGCGCCLTCALSEGEPCGVYTERCGAGLRCHPHPGEPRPLQALLEGRGLCINASAVDYLSAYLLHGAPLSGNASESEEDDAVESSETQALPSTYRVPESRYRPVHSKVDLIKKARARDSQRYRMLSGSHSTDTTHSDTTQNFSSETKREPEYGPCRREMEDTLNHLKFLNVLNPRRIHIPNCDKRGFYKKKQCRPSKGRKRGFCWCVDKYGQRLPGYDAKGKGDIQCYTLESK
ncbi:insulin-like growth factor-binding protein 3 [Tamandua tetradactyla]|uniref:insulin-like growth factor-binding protein 3 n=1 Tax=Tamandua tetradactyla TaxID=48850 RepID=UPI004054312E